jgi:16S rRNA (uracil1498-N3)-methyltransferase
MIRRFFSPPENFDQTGAVLEAGESRHLRDVLRLRIGDAVQVFDGVGNEFVCRIETIGRSSCKLRIEKKIVPSSPESPLDLTIAAAILKGDVFDLVIQKFVELGVKKIAPITTHRSEVVIKTETDSKKKLDRWKRISLEAAKQCGRAFVPEILPAGSFETFIGSASADLKILFAEESGTSFQKLPAKLGKNTAIALIGPKGGWDSKEIALARKKDFHIITLGGRILRAETAAIALTALLQHRFGDLK